MATFIEPKILKGFRDFLPPAEIARRTVLESFERCFRSYGFVPIDTPALEYAEILLGKGGGETEKQIYRFTDKGGRDVALRFDLTVPFARFVAEHRGELALPFRRYHIAKVWRGENTQRGRYREFTQCDFDILGSDSAAADFEILLIIRTALLNLEAGDVCIRVNHRGLFNRFLARLGIEPEQSVEILRTVDKIGKIGQEATLGLLSELLNPETAREILGFIQIKGDFEQTLESLAEAVGGKTPEIARLALLRRFMEDTGTADTFVLDPSITRGLDYYTGVVYETFLTELPDIGSVCSGGRYDNLAGLYEKNCKETISGVGSSIGLDRLMAALETLGKVAAPLSYSQVAIACIREEDAGAYQALAGALRRQGIPCEVLLTPEKLTKQAVLAEKKGARFLVIPGADPLKEPFTVRDLRSRTNQEGLSLEGLITRLR